MTGPFTTCGKQVLRAGEHFADATDVAAAVSIAAMMNLPDWLDAKADAAPPKARVAARFCRALASDLRAGLHERSTDEAL